jgi:hypothetical protein
MRSATEKLSSFAPLSARRAGDPYEVARGRAMHFLGLYDTAAAAKAYAESP